MPIKRHSEFDREITITHRELMDAVIKATRRASLSFIPDTNGEPVHECFFAAVVAAAVRELILEWQECLPDADDDDD